MFSTQEHPLAIAMWDFSWLERRWPEGGFQDLEKVLGELVERGYDAVRIDAYPHLVATDPMREWELVPVWDQHWWGSPVLTSVRVWPELEGFLAACRAHGVKVALSTWFRETTDDVRTKLVSGADHGRIWADALDLIASAGLLDTVLYVDLCNEWPLRPWTPFLPHPHDQPVLDDVGLSRRDPVAVEWRSEALAVVRERHPGIPLTFSTSTEHERWAAEDVSGLDFLEPHIWLAQPWVSDFYARLGYDLTASSWDQNQYQVLTGAAELYQAAAGQWWQALLHEIARMATWSRATGKPLVTTECWSVVAWRDGPGLDWGWIKELCAHGTTTASDTGRWAAIATSNFCSPQFTGMWRDVGWHRALADRIHRGVLRPHTFHPDLVPAVGLPAE